MFQVFVQPGGRGQGSELTNKHFPLCTVFFDEVSTFANFCKDLVSFLSISEICEEPGEEVYVDHLVAIEDKAVGLFVSTQPSEAANQMFDGSGGAYQAANGDITVNKR